jgi:hypothetical protein
VTPSKLTDLLALAQRIMDPTAAVATRRTVVDSYATPLERAAYNAARTFAGVVQGRWADYATTFTAQAKGGGVAPRAHSYHVDLDQLIFHQQTVDLYDGRELAGINSIKVQWVTQHMAPAHIWHRLGLTHAFVNGHDVNELLNSTSGRVRVWIRNYLTRGYPWIFDDVLHMQGHPTMAWNLGSGTHTTLLRINGAATWRMDGVATLAQSITAVLGVGVSSLHATRELYGQNSQHNPKRYLGFPLGVKPAAVSLNDWTVMQLALADREAKIRTAITTRAAALSAGLVAGWEVAV